MQGVGGTLLVVGLVAMVAWFATGPGPRPGPQSGPTSVTSERASSPVPSSSVLVPSSPATVPGPKATPVSPTPGSPTMPPTPAPSGAQPLPTSALCRPVMGEDELVVVSYNIGSGRWQGRNRLPEIAAALRDWEADVVLLQEVQQGRRAPGGVDTAAWLGSALGMHHVFGANVRWGPGALYGTAILSRHPIVESGNTLLPNGRGYQQRGLLHAVVDVEGRHVSVYNTHLQHGRRRTAIRMEQVRTIVRIVAADPRPVIVGGDFNSWPGTPVMELVRRVVADAWAEAGAGSGDTAPVDQPKVRIDYVMHRGLEPAHAEVMPAALSQHRALRTAFRTTTLASLDCSTPAGG